MIRKPTLVLFGALLVAGCSPGREAQTVTNSGEIPIGVFGAQTGPEAAFGTSSANGVRLAAEEINAALADEDYQAIAAMTSACA